jgi:hypothetical protein
MKKSIPFLSLLLLAVPAFSQPIQPGQAGDMPSMQKYLILIGGLAAIVLILLVLRTQNRKKGGL